jgi:hypothetical protein
MGKAGHLLEQPVIAKQEYCVLNLNTKYKNDYFLITCLPGGFRESAEILVFF